MEGVKSETRRQIIMNFYRQNKSKGKPYTWKHFKKQGVPRATVYRALERVDTDKSFGHSKGAGRPKKLNRQQERQVRDKIENKKGVSPKQIAGKLRVSRQTVMRAYQRQGGKYFLKKRASLVKDKQLPRILAACRALSTSYYPPSSSTSIVIDDKSYFPVDNKSLSRNRGFWSRDPSSAPDDVRFRKETKFPEKILISVVISERGFSEPYFTPALRVSCFLFLPFFAIVCHFFIYSISI